MSFNVENAFYKELSALALFSVLNKMSTFNSTLHKIKDSIINDAIFLMVELFI